MELSTTVKQCLEALKDKMVKNTYIFTTLEKAYITMLYKELTKKDIPANCSNCYSKAMNEIKRILKIH